jgi:hypothetical protein
MKLDVKKQLRYMRACPEAVRWANKRMYWEKAWLECNRGDWLLWLVDHLPVDRRYVVAAAMGCIQGVANFVPEGDESVTNFLEVIGGWVKGPKSADDVYDSSACMWDTDALYHSRFYYVCHAIESCSDILRTKSADDVAVFCARAFSAKEKRDEFYHGKYKRALKLCADRVRAVIPWEIVEEALKDRIPSSVDFVNYARRE